MDSINVKEFFETQAGLGIHSFPETSNEVDKFQI